MQIKEVINLGMYDSRIVYPPEFDEIEFCTVSDTCPHSNGECFDAGECLKVTKNEECFFNRS